MGDLVSKHTGQRILGLHARNETGVNKNLASGDGESVNTVVADDEKLVVKGLYAKGPNDTTADLGHHLVDLVIVDKRQPLARFADELLAQLFLHANRGRGRDRQTGQLG